ncbi:MAG: NADH-quinone oxidoreductase subunit J [Candidatus Zixiibacteriota bacterium]
MEQIIFWVCAIVAVAAALRVVLLRNPIVSVLHLIVTLVALAVIFLQLSAEFIAALQIIIYAGAIMVLFLFIVMMLNLRRDEFGEDRLPGVRFLGGLAFAAMLTQLVIMFTGGSSGSRAATVAEGFGGIQAVGRELFGDYLLPFELTSVLLLAAVIAAVVVGRHRKQSRQTGEAAS